MKEKYHSEAKPDSDVVLSVDELNVAYSTADGAVRAVRDVSLDVARGETLGIAGESGSGKSTLALAILQYLGENGSITGGSIEFDGQSLRDLSKKRLQKLRGNEIAHVAQDAKRSLNPSLTVGEQVRETIKKHQDVTREEARKKAIEILGRVNIPDPESNAERHPHELSGGQQQRVLIAMALSCNPELLILDEPTTGLDVTTETKILDLIEELKVEYNTTIILITHNLETIAQICDRVSIMYAGEIMEKGPISAVFNNPTNPYTQGLLAATPEIGSGKMPKKTPGQVPSLTDLPDGCVFADRCAFATDECRGDPVQMHTVSDNNHQTRCRRWKHAVEDPIKPETGEYEQMEAGDVVIRAQNLKKLFDKPTSVEQFLTDGPLGDFVDFQPPVKAVNDVSLTIRESETVGIVGESGSGKSTLGRTLLQLLDADDGSVEYDGADLTSFDSDALRDFYSQCQLVFQNPHSSLNPRKTVGETISKPLKIFTDLSQSERRDRVRELLEQVELGPEYASRYPHEMSGGEKQRVAIARAFAPRPSLIVLDEPTSALDVSVQANILNLLSDLRKEYGTAYAFISHDLSVINTICDKIIVMYLGEIVEAGTRDEIFQPPYHPYTRALLSSVSPLDPDREHDPIRLEGDVPSMREPPSGCSFHTRCPQKIGEVCETECPSLEEVGGKNGDDPHQISCHLDKDGMDTEIPGMNRPTETE
jgi:peptide/nickel transport system ATP-binding protein